MREKFGDGELHELTGHVPAAFHVAAKMSGSARTSRTYSPRPGASSSRPTTSRSG